MAVYQAKQPNQRARLGGSAYTFFRWRGKIIGFAQMVRHTAVPLVADPEQIQPLNAQFPLEILTPAAHRAGLLTLRLIEIYHEAVWQRLSLLRNAENVVDVMEIMAENHTVNGGVQVTRVIRPPFGNKRPYYETYYNCMITRIQDDEEISVDTMHLEKEIDVMYTHSRKQWINSPRTLQREARTAAAGQE